jgi:hypothetical protein
MLVRLSRMVGQLLMQAAPTRGGSHQGFGRGGLLELRDKKNGIFLKWACLTCFILKQAVLTHGVYKPQILLRMTSQLIKVSVGAQPWMVEACITRFMFLLNGSNKKCDWHALVISAQ